MVRVVFCDFSKAFDRVRHIGLLFKLRKLGLNGGLLECFGSYLSNRKQRVILNNATSKIGTINAGVPQGSVLGPLLFLIFINDITENIGTNIRLFADDTTLFIDFNDEVEAVNNINSDLATINKWAEQWLVSFCPSKTESLLVSLKKRKDLPPPSTFGASVIKEVTAHKHLSVILSSNLSWGSHKEDCINRAGRRVDILARLMYRLDHNTLEIISSTSFRIWWHSYE